MGNSAPVSLDPPLSKPARARRGFLRGLAGGGPLNIGPGAAADCGAAFCGSIFRAKYCAAFVYTQLFLKSVRIFRHTILLAVFIGCTVNQSVSHTQMKGTKMETTGKSFWDWTDEDMRRHQDGLYATWDLWDAI